jgi:hypothetical protein
MILLQLNSLDISINCGVHESLILKPFTQQYHEDELGQDYAKEM